MSGLGEFSNKYENILRVSCAANEYLKNINNLDLINNLTEKNNQYSFTLDKKENVCESYKNVIKYCNLVVQTYPTILNMDYFFDEKSKKATIKHLQDFQALLWLKTIISDCHHHLLVIPASILIFNQKLKEFRDKNLEPKKAKNKQTIYELMIEEEKNRILNAGILRDKKYIKDSTKAHKLILKLIKKNKLYLKDTKNIAVELIKKYISQNEIVQAANSQNPMDFNRIYIHALSSQKVDEKPAEYEKKVKFYEKQIVDQFNKETGIEKIEDTVYDVLYYSLVMQTAIDEIYYFFEHNNYLSNFSVPCKIRSEEQVQHLIDFLKEGRANNLDEAIELYKKEVAYPYEIVLDNDQFEKEEKERKEFLKTLEKNRKQDYYVGAMNIVNQNKDFIDKEIDKLVNSVNNQINKIGLLPYVKGVSKLIPHKGFVMVD